MPERFTRVIAHRIRSGKYSFRIRPQVLTILVLGTLTAGAVATSWLAYDKIGRTPGELMDYVEHRLVGHPKLELFALPVMAYIRDWLNEPSRKERMSIPFFVPAPPMLNTAAALPGRTNASEINSRILRVGPDEKIRSIAEASKLAKDGDIVEIQSGEYFGDVAVWLQKKLFIRGIAGNARLHAAGKSAENKAIWVIRNGDFTIENIDFIGTKVHDKNGAGIRFENGHLRLKNCLFWGNENGLLTTGGANHRNAKLEIENSEFAYNGNGDGLSHNLYVGAIDYLRVTGSYFHHANVGHLLKSRAKINEIEYNRLTDESGGRASYEIDLPNGGIAYIVGNLVQQNKDTENSTILSFGAEGPAWPENRLYLASNTLANDHPYGGAFLRVYSGADRVISMNNILVGKGKLHANIDIRSLNDAHARWEIFSKASRYNYHLSSIREYPPYQEPSVGPEERAKLIPNREYSHPRQIRNLQSKPLAAGAFQPSGD